MKPPRRARAAALVRMPQGLWEPASVQLTEPAGNQNQLGDTIFVDPVSLEILGSAERRRNGEFMRFLTSMHLALMFPSYYGAQTVGWMGVAMCLFGVVRPDPVVAEERASGVRRFV